MNDDEESDFGENPFGEYDIEYQFQDEPNKPTQAEIVRNLLFKPNPKFWKDKRK